MLEAQGFFRQEEQEIHQLTLELEALENSQELRILKDQALNEEQQWALRIHERQQNNKIAKTLRDEKRKTIIEMKQKTLKNYFLN